jgi:hypothetical protein
MRNSLQQPKSTSRSLVFDEALRLNQIGLSIISIGANKKPAISSWKKYQYEAAAEQVIRGWFSKNEDLGVGIVLGLPSQSLYARDFDTLDAYERWRLANPEHATRLPTVATARGKHVYGRWREVRTQKFADGELRGIGAYVVAPPSIHPTGFQYQWDIPLISLDDIPLIDPIEAGFVTTDEDATDRHRLDTVGSVRLVGSVLCEQSVLSVAGDFSIVEQLISSTQPSAPGRRRGCLFELARRIRVHPSLDKEPLKNLKQLVKKWHQLALLAIQTKSFDETWSDFVEGYNNVDITRCGDSAKQALERADWEPLCAEALQYDSIIVRRLVGLCCQLSVVNPDRQFFLACRKAAELLETSDFKYVARLLQMLTADGIIQELEKGGPKTNKATRYRWLGSAQASTRKFAPPGGPCK